MRCGQCGTQNEPDSRFCGGCGARVAGGENRLAPTEKIQSDAPMQVQPLSSISPNAGVVAPPRRMSTPPEMPAPTPIPGARLDVAAVPASIPPNNNGQWSAAAPSYNGAPSPSLPPQGSSGAARQAGTGPSSIPPQNQVGNATGPSPSLPQAVPAGSTRTAKPAPSSGADLSMRPSRTRWGLIILLLLFDAGLATAGTWMLLEGLADPPAVVAPTTSGAIQPAASTLRVADAPPAVETKPIETKPIETKPAETKPVDPQPVDTKPADTKPADTKPADTTPAGTTPADTKPADTKPAAPKPADKPPLDTKARNDKPADTTPPVEKPVEKTSKKGDDKKPGKKKPSKEQGRTGPLDPYGDPLPPEAE